MRILLLALSLLSGQILAQTQQFTLDNGLKILVREDHRAPIAVSMIWYNVGSADERGGSTGLSHALEHLMFKGTKKFPLGVFSKTISSLGGTENAFTSNDYTAYHEKIAASHLAVSFELEADRMTHLLLDKDEFAKEINVIQEERRLRTDDNPQALTFERFLATAHLSTPYHHPVIGWMSDLKHMSVNDAKAWYQRFYAPNNATLVVVGDVSASNVYALAKHYFGPLARQPLPVRPIQEEPHALGKKTVLVHTAVNVPILMLGYTVPTLKTANQSTKDVPYILDVISGLLDAGDSGRLGKHLIHGTQVASSANTYYNKYARYQTQFVLFGTPSKTHTVAELQAGIESELNNLKTNRVDEQALARIKTQLIAAKTFELDSVYAQAMELGILETIGLGWQIADNYVDIINSITAEQVQKTAQRYFIDNQMTTAELIPVPEQNDIHKTR